MLEQTTELIIKYLYIIPLAYLLISSALEDYKTKMVSDLKLIGIVLILLLKDGFSYTTIENNAVLIFISLGATVLLKILMENIVFMTTKNDNGFEFNEADVLFIGVLGMFFNLVGYVVFIYLIVYIWMIIKFKKEQRLNQDKFKVLEIPLLPAIVMGFFLTVILMNM